MQPRGPIPSRLGRYEVVNHLATGGMADLLLACTSDASGVRQHAVVKRIPPAQLGDPTFVQMFLDEARIATLLQHPNIVRVIETGEDRGEYFFAMEYIHGEDLRKVLKEVFQRRDQVPIALVTSIVAGAAAGLHHAHKLLGPDHRPLGIVHRDVSPANILIGYDGVVRVTDFGIAKAALRTIETRSGTLKGKVSYMSPEQVAGKYVDRRSDVFALGIVLYELATARRLFKGENDFLTMSAIVQGEIPLPSTLRPDLPKPLEAIIMTALALSPTERFQSAEELRAALAEFTESLGMKMSTTGIADYMKNLFGNRPEPWLVDDEPTHTGEVDFDGAGVGLARVPDTFAFPQNMRPASSAPIVYARAFVTNEPVAQHEIDTAPPRAWTEVATGSGSNDSYAWMRDASERVRPPSRRWIAIAAGILVAGVAAAVIVIMSPTSKTEPAAAPVQMAVSAPTVEEPKIEPTPVEPEPAVAPPVKRDPRAEAAAAAEAAKAEADAQAEAARVAKEKAAAAKAEAARVAKEEAAKSEAEKREAARIAKAEAAKTEADKREAARIAKAEAAKADAEKREAARIAKAEAAKADAEKKEAARVAKAEAAKADAARRSAAKAEAAKVAAKAKANKSRSRKTETKTTDKGPAWNPDSMFAPK